MQPNKLLDTLRKLEQVKGLKNLHLKLEPKPCHLILKPQSYQTPEKVLEMVKNFAPEQGWLCFQSNVEYFCQQDFCEHKSLPDSGLLLYGEVVNAQGQSLHIREDGEGGWILTEFEETEGDDFLVEERTFLGEKQLFLKKTEEQQFLGEKQLFLEKTDVPKLLYRVYWQYDEKHGYRQFSACFKGFLQS